VDSGNELPGFDNHIYTSVAAVKEMAKLIKWVSPEDHSVALAQRDAALSRIEALEEDLAEERRKVEAIDFLGSTDFVARKKRGPKPQAERTAA
jgi:hypothetical protein